MSVELTKKNQKYVSFLRPPNHKRHDEIKTQASPKRLRNSLYTFLHIFLEFSAFLLYQKIRGHEY